MTARYQRLMLSVLAATTFAGPLAAGEADHEPDDTHEHGASFFGEAKDIKGFEPLADVIVRLQLKGTMRFVMTQTDGEGRFRRPGLGPDVDAEAIEVICQKSGYRTVEVIRRRLSKAKDAPVEVECLLEKS